MFEEKFEEFDVGFETFDVTFETFNHFLVIFEERVQL